MDRHHDPARLALPPPLDFPLADHDRLVGWVQHDVVGFCGFGDEQEAAHAAWVAYRTLDRRLARSRGRRPIPIDAAPLTIDLGRVPHVVRASGAPIAELYPPGSERAGAAGFAFGIRIPHPADELRMRAMAYLMYLALRKSGLRWALFARPPRRAEPRVPPSAAAPTRRRVPSLATPARRARRAVAALVRELRGLTAVLRGRPDAVGTEPA